ncbi:MAG: putative integral membrane protein [Candidatus Paceibacteria bacterium]|jgi:uncharacterized integral membrane protein
MKFFIRFFTTLGIFISVVILVFVVQNNEEVTVQFFTYDFSGPISLILISTLIVGFLVGLILIFPGNIKRYMKVNKLLKENNLYKKKIEDDKKKIEDDKKKIEDDKKK